jgi:hypothetical protein
MILGLYRIIIDCVDGFPYPNGGVFVHKITSAVAKMPGNQIAVTLNAKVHMLQVVQTHGLEKGLEDFGISNNCVNNINKGGKRLRSWLRHYATSRKVADLIPDDVIEFLSLPNPSSRTMALGSTEPLTQMSTRNLHGG